MTIRVGVFGVGGRMGTEVAAAVSEAEGLSFVAAVDPASAGRKADGVIVAETNAGLLGADGTPLVDVMIDFTHLEAARSNLGFCADHGIHAVVGTSGFVEADHAGLAASFTSSNCLLAANFAIGAVLMMRFAELAAPYFEAAEIIELHHENKVDAPSGTALATAERMAAASGDWITDPTESETIANARGAHGPAGIRLHSVRMRGMTAHQEVVLGTTGQTLTLRHDSFDRSSFMPGVVLAARRIGDAVEPLTVGLDRLLDL